MFKAAHRRAAVVVAVCAVVLVASAGPATAQGTTVVCESTQGERAFCSADTSQGVTLQRQLGDAPCTGNWGSDENGIWVTNRCRGEFLLGQAGDQGATASSVLSTWIDRITGGDSTPTPSSESVVVCESQDNKRVTCPVDTRGGVELQRQLSSASCTGAWGYTPDGIWVDNGCRAEFKVYPVQASTPTPAPAQIVTCESQDNKRETCPVDTRGGVELQRQLSSASCTGAWGYTPDGIWVDNGCRAEFRVYLVQVSTPTPVPAQIVTCESQDNKRETCPVDTRGGVEFQRQLSSASCAGAWGHTPDGIWVDNGCRAEFRVYPVQASIPTPAPEQMLVCESMNNQRAFCSADTRGGVVFQRQLGQATCVGHWGYDSGGVWVDNGCRAEFRITHIRPQSTILPGPGSVVTCESNSSERSYCPADTRSGVTLQRQLSSAACVGHWGYDAVGIWVDSGCRAEFVMR